MANFDLQEKIVDLLSGLIVTMIVYMVQAWIAQWLWNTLIDIPHLFGCGRLNYPQTYGLIWLSHILFTKSSSSED